MENNNNTEVKKPKTVKVSIEIEKSDCELMGGKEHLEKLISISVSQYLQKKQAERAEYERLNPPVINKVIETCGSGRFVQPSLFDENN